uniref:Secreted protein n=1 Tax=Angiostrongylus cantonensis TaxID=6313 RepID=A0A0K0D4Y0_ANGCA
MSVTSRLQIHKCIALFELFACREVSTVHTLFEKTHTIGRIFGGGSPFPIDKSTPTSQSKEAIKTDGDRDEEKREENMLIPSLLEK